MTNDKPTNPTATCRDCMRRREVYSISRSGGGNYRRGGRDYRSSICAECAIEHVRTLGAHGGASSSRFSGIGLVRIVESLDTPEAVQVAAEYRARVAERKAQQEKWRAEAEAASAAKNDQTR